MIPVNPESRVLCNDCAFAGQKVLAVLEYRRDETFKIYLVANWLVAAEMVNGKSGAKEQRKTVRRPASIGGYILDPNAGIIADCLVRDFSGSGARLRVLQPVEVPSVCWLKLKGDGTLRYCNVRWRRGKEVGVEFTRDKLLRVAEDEVQQLRNQLSWTKASEKGDLTAAK